MTKDDLEASTMVYPAQRRRRTPLLTIACLIVVFVLVISEFRNLLPVNVGYTTYRPTPAGSQLLDHVYNSTFGFGKILVVNLPSRTDHHDAMVLTAALSDVKLEFIDGQKGDKIPDKALPPGASRADLGDGYIGSWRAHLNAIATVVQQNLSSALILEDDNDWDIRIKPQLRDFALASQALMQPRVKPAADAPHPPSDAAKIINDLVFPNLPETVTPTVSPYGDHWDLLWLGHCGMLVPDGTGATPTQPAEPTGTESPQPALPNTNASMDRVVFLQDHTVPEKHYLNNYYEKENPLLGFPPHTRVVHHPRGSVCSLAYAISQAGARRILYDMGIKAFTKPFDIMLRDFCDGANGHETHNCLTVQPQLFSSHWPVGMTGAESDISAMKNQPRDKAHTQNIRWSTRINIERLLRGQTEFVDQYPDEGRYN